MKKLLLLLIVGISAALCQHNIPFASTGNVIELSVVNAGMLPMSGAEVNLENAPAWLKFSETRQAVDNIPVNQGKPVMFSFSADKSAPVNTPYVLRFSIVSSAGERWTKEITLQVSPPEKFELFQNYPNPFNPTTTISYQLPANGEVSLKIFDAVGREVATLFEGVEQAGYSEHHWNASNAASGMYIYQLAAKNEKGRYEFYRKKMLMVK